MVIRLRLCLPATACSLVWDSAMARLHLTILAVRAIEGSLMVVSVVVTRAVTEMVLMTSDRFE